MGATVQAISTGDSWMSYGNRRAVFGTLAMSASYATNGDTVTPGGYGLGTLDALVFLGQPAGYTLYFDKTNLKVKAYRGGGFTPAGTNATSALSQGIAAAQSITATAAITMAAHTHQLWFQGTAASNAVTAAANQLRNATGSAFGVDGVVDTAGEGGVVNVVSTGTAAVTGTNSTSSVSGTAAAQTFTGAAVAAAALVEVSNAVNLSAVSANVQAVGV